MRRTFASDLVVPLGGLTSFAVSGALVGVRGEIHPEVTALTLAAVVALAGRLGGRAAGATAAVVAALSFDFMHTKPYLSLKIANTDDILTTVLLLLVGLIVGGLATSADADKRRVRDAKADPGGLGRVLDVARTSSPEDVQLSVRAELLGLLELHDCWFTTDTVLLPMLGIHGELNMAGLRYTHDGFELPRDGVAIEVASYGKTYGYLVCLPTAGVGTSLEQRRVAVELANVLGLAMSTRSEAA